MELIQPLKPYQKAFDNCTGTACYYSRARNAHKLRIP